MKNPTIDKGQIATPTIGVCKYTFNVLNFSFRICVVFYIDQLKVQDSCLSSDCYSANTSMIVLIEFAITLVVHVDLHV